MEALGAIYYGLLGAAIGSFLNLCIDRLPYGRSIISPPSHCGSCARRLEPLELVPIFSFLLLKGRCRTCGAAISNRVLVVELLTAGTYGLIWLWQGPGLGLAIVTVYVSLLILITFIDLEHRLILNRVIYPAIVLALPAALLYGIGITESLLGGAVGFVIMFVIYLVANWYSSGSLGLGDVMLVTFVGLFLGLQKIFIALYAASLLGGIVAAILLITKLKGRKDPVPYAPFICLGAFIGLVAGEPLSQWYLQFI